MFLLTKFMYSVELQLSFDIFESNSIELTFPTPFTQSTVMLRKSAGNNYPFELSTRPILQTAIWKSGFRRKLKIAGFWDFHITYHCAAVYGMCNLVCQYMKLEYSQNVKNHNMQRTQVKTYRFIWQRYSLHQKNQSLFYILCNIRMYWMHLWHLAIRA